MAMIYKCPDIQITVVDLNEHRIAEWNSRRLFMNLDYGDCRVGLKSKFFFSPDIDANLKEADIIFISVNTPTKDYGWPGKAADLRLRLCPSHCRSWWWK